jgi:putative cardiolipin synthase
VVDVLESARAGLRGAARGVALLALLAATGCASLPDLVAPAPTGAIPASAATSLGRIAAASQVDAELTGVRLIADGDFAFDTRLELARRAERSLDLQYYQIQNDAAGRTLLRAVRDAAQRGVRVRLLLDDLFTAGDDELLLAFAATPNVELRLFNPFPAGRSSLASRFAASLFDVSRVHRRMHNKLFVADGAFAVVGGRNIGNEYFAQVAGDANFLDLDALIAGALLPRLGELFDLYWNSVYVRSIESVAATQLDRAALQARFEALTDTATTPAPRPPVPYDALDYAPVSAELDAGRLRLVWAPAEAHADRPDRVIGKTVDYGGVPLIDVDSVRYNVVELIRRALSDVSITSPYFVPRAAGIEELAALRRRGVAISVVTNSLASTDEPLVYGAYRRYRDDMLRVGVEIWELGSLRSRSGVRLGLRASRIGRLHAKAAVIDGRVLFIGSMNFDPRSAVHNTELAVIVRSAELAGQLLTLSERLKEQGAWRLRLGSGGEVEWVSGEPGRERVLDQDPDTGFWDRAVPALLAPLVPESLL